MNKKLLSFILFVYFSIFSAGADVIWTIGNDDNSGADLALGPAGYKDFLARDFGYEDRFFLIGTSVDKTDFPYVLPGPDDTWGGTWGTSGWRTHEANILFNLSKASGKGMCKLVIDLVDSSPSRSVVKVTVNSVEKKFEIKGASKDVLEGRVQQAKERMLEVPFSAAELKEGGNVVTVSVLEGGWIVFDRIFLEGPDKLVLQADNKLAFLRNVSPAAYETELGGKRVQPLLVDIEHLEGAPQLTVKLDDQEIFSAPLDTARYIFEAPMPAVKKNK